MTRLICRLIGNHRYSIHTSYKGICGKQCWCGAHTIIWPVR